MVPGLELLFAQVRDGDVPTNRNLPEPYQLSLEIAKAIAS